MGYTQITVELANTLSVWRHLQFCHCDIWATLEKKDKIDILSIWLYLPAQWSDRILIVQPLIYQRAQWTPHRQCLYHSVVQQPHGTWPRTEVFSPNPTQAIL